MRSRLFVSAYLAFCRRRQEWASLWPWHPFGLRGRPWPPSPVCGPLRVSTPRAPRARPRRCARQTSRDASAIGSGGPCPAGRGSACGSSRAARSDRWQGGDCVPVIGFAHVLSPATDSVVSVSANASDCDGGAICSGRDGQGSACGSVLCAAIDCVWSARVDLWSDFRRDGRLVSRTGPVSVASGSSLVLATVSACCAFDCLHGCGSDFWTFLARGLSCGTDCDLCDCRTISRPLGAGSCAFRFWNRSRSLFVTPF